MLGSRDSVRRSALLLAGIATACSVDYIVDQDEYEKQRCQHTGTPCPDGSTGGTTSDGAAAGGSPDRDGSTGGSPDAGMNARDGGGRGGTSGGGSDGMDAGCSYTDDIDHDGDGWAFTDGDCDDCSERVNPGAYEFAGNGTDDDCDASTVDGVAADPCSTSARFSAVTPLDAAGAMDICQVAVANAPLAERRWGLLSAEYRLANGDVPAATAQSNMADWQTAVLTDYGTGGIVPLFGTTMLGLSTGRMRDAADPGFVAPTPGTNFESVSTPPALFLAAHGGSLTGSSGCSGTCTGGDGANDSVGLRLQIRAPTNAASFTFRYRFFSVSYWLWVCTIYNDFFLALVTSGGTGIPVDANVALDSLGNPVSLNNVYFETCAPKGCHSCTLGAAPLAGTGLEALAGGGTGGGTDWLSSTVAVAPGETVTIDLMIFDVGDGSDDSVVLIDDVSWNPLP